MTVTQSSGAAIIAQRSSHSEYQAGSSLAAPAPEERIYFGFLGSRGSGKGKGFGTVKTWDIFFTDRRLICAKIGGSGGKAYFLGGVIGYAIGKKMEDIRRHKLAQKNLDSILGSNKRNFEIPYEQIYQVEIIKGVLACSLNITDVNGNRYKFAIKKPECAPAIQTLYPLLGYKLTY